MAPLHLKYRPKNLSDLFGNEEVKTRLGPLLDRKTDIPQGFLLCGETGCGKTTLARIIRERVGCDERDFREYNTANTRGIDTIRDIANDCIYAPMYGSSKVFLLDECHKLTNEAQNALLKLTEEPPRNVYFILSTTNEEKLLPTLKSGRLNEFRMKKLNYPDLVNLITYVLGEEDKLDFPRKAVKEIALAADGIPRLALAILDSVINLPEGELIQQIQSFAISLLDFSDLCKVLISTNQNRWKECSKILKTLSADDPEEVRLGIRSYLSKVLLDTGDERIGKLMAYFRQPYFATGKSNLIEDCFDACQV